MLTQRRLLNSWSCNYGAHTWENHSLLFTSEDYAWNSFNWEEILSINLHIVVFKFSHQKHSLQLARVSYERIGVSAFWRCELAIVPLKTGFFESSEVSKNRSKLFLYQGAANTCRLTEFTIIKWNKVHLMELMKVCSSGQFVIEFKALCGPTFTGLHFLDPCQRNRTVFVMFYLFFCET